MAEMGVLSKFERVAEHLSQNRMIYGAEYKGITFYAQGNDLVIGIGKEKAILSPTDIPEFLSKLIQVSAVAVWQRKRRLEEKIEKLNRILEANPDNAGARTEVEETLASLAEVEKVYKLLRVVTR
ncbi:MAG: hypothetical protein QXU69_05930 [Thermofilaceae archaeon]